jgi:hypothetical protein
MSRESEGSRHIVDSPEFAITCYDFKSIPLQGALLTMSYSLLTFHCLPVLRKGGKIRERKIEESGKLKMRIVSGDFFWEMQDGVDYASI